VSLRLRISIAAALLLVVLSVLGVLLVSFVGNAEVRQVDQQLEDTFPVARTIEGATSIPSSSSTSPPRSASANHLSAFYMAVITDGHRTVISTQLDTAKESPRSPEVLSTSKRDISIVTVGSRSGSQSWRAILVPRPNTNSDLLVAVSLSQVNSTMRFLRDALLLAGIIMLAVVVATGYWIARLGLRPIAEVTEVADAIAAGDRTRRVAKSKHGTEASKLADAFNLMLDEQLAIEERLRQFVADASHELRTPVSVIMGITDLWRQGKLRIGEESDEAIHRIGVAGGQMGTLVEELLLLARLDEGQPLGHSPVNLSQLVIDVVADAATTDPLRPVTVHVPGPVVVDGDNLGLRRVVANLVTNALRHTPADAEIEVRVTLEGEIARLEVRDAGPGMTSDEQRHAFDRFWQADSSRSRSGAGLGLPIVRGIVTAHHGHVTLESDSASGTRFTVTLPRRAATLDESVPGEHDELVE
jgi:two-component system OmpR family sensor kinase